MDAKEIAKYIVKTPMPGTAKGFPRLAGRRISVVDVVMWHNEGLSPEEIAATYDLDATAVCAALAYYDRNRAEIEGYLKEGDAFFEAGHLAQENDPVYQGLKARRRALAARDGVQPG